MVGEEPYSNIRRTPRGSTSVSKLCLKPKRRKPAKQQAFLKWSVKRNSTRMGFHRTGVPAPALYNQNIAKRPYISAGPFLNMAGEEPYSNVRRTPRGSTSVSKLCLKPKRRKPAKKQAFLKWSVKRDSNPRPSGPKPDALPSCAIHRDVSQKLCSVNGCVYYGFWLTTQELSAVFFNNLSVCLFRHQ